MAKIEFKGIDEYAEKLAKLGARAEGVCKYAVYEAAGMIADAIRASTPEDTGDLRDSLALTPFRNENGFIYTKISFEGYDRGGTPNAIKAAVLESGSSTRKKHPFIRPAVNRVKKAVEFSIETRLNEKIDEIMKEG